jgi:hypothetical protein
MTTAATRRSLFTAAAGAAGAAALASGPALATSQGSPAGLLAAGARAATWTGDGRLYGRRAGETPRLIAQIAFHRAVRLTPVAPARDQALAGLTLATFDWAELEPAGPNPWTGEALPRLIALGASAAPLLALEQTAGEVRAERAGEGLLGLETLSVGAGGFALTLETGWPDAFSMAGWTGGLTWRASGAVAPGLPASLPVAAQDFAAWLHSA